MHVENYIFLVVLAAAAGMMSRSVLRLVSYMKFAKPENRLDNIGARLKQTLLVGFAGTEDFT